MLVSRKLFEISDSTLTYDLGEKAKRYAANHILEYWVADIKSNILYIYKELKNHQYQQVYSQTGGTIPFQDLLIDIDEIFWRK